MTLLFILAALLTVAVIYALFFLLFKLIWILLKKDSNKWPLIWAGVSTAVFGILLSAVMAWSVYKVISPFRGMIERFSANPTPVYGERIYTDPVYRFELDVFNGMDFSEWMEFDDIDVKVGFDTNLLKKESPSSSNQAVNTFFGAILFRQSDVDEGHPLEELRKNLNTFSNNRREMEILSEENVTVDGYPALFITGKAFGNRGESIPFWLNAISAPYEQVFYVITFIVETNNAELNVLAANQAQQMARSLRLENGASLPPATDAQPPLETNENQPETTTK